MNKNYIFVGVGIVIVVIILAITLSQNSTVSMTLDEIIKNRDCKALHEWELDHSFDANLDITSKQMTEGVQLAMECTGKVLDNMMGISSSSQSAESDNEITVDNTVDTPTTIQDEYEIQITLDKQQYRVGETMQIDVTISPDWYDGITIGIDSSGSNRYKISDKNQDSEYDMTLKISPLWGDIGIHNVNLRNNAYSNFGDITPFVEFEIIE